MTDQFYAGVGPTHDPDGIIPDKPKIFAADGIIGIIVLLSYYGGGTNLFPIVKNPSCDPKFFVEDPKKERAHKVVIDFPNLLELVGQVSKAIGRDIGYLGASSFPAYISNLRQGFRPNKKARCVPVDVKYLPADGQRLYITPRNFTHDKTHGLTKCLPEMGLVFVEAEDSVVLVNNKQGEKDEK